MGCSAGQCFVNPAAAGVLMGSGPSQPIELLSGGLVGRPAPKRVVGNSGVWRPRQNCGMPYTAEFQESFREAADHDVAVGCATGAREIVATAPAGCDCPDKTAPAAGVSPTLPLLVPEAPPMRTAPAGQTTPLGLIAPTIAPRRYLGAGIPAPSVAGSPPTTAVPVMGAFTQSQCHQPASWYASPPVGAFTNCYAADIAAARQAEAAARGGSGGGSTATGPITSSADCTARGGVAFSAVREDGSSAPACLRADGVKEWIGSGGQSDTSTVQVVGAIANAVGGTTRDILAFINQQNNNDLQLELARLTNSTQLQIAAMNQGNAQLAQRYQEQANAQQASLITMLMSRMGQMNQQPTFGQMLPMLTIGALAIGGAFLLTRR